MKISEGDIHEVPLLAIEGELDHSSKEEARDAVNAILHGAFPPRNLLVDLSDCTYLDSGGLGVLFSALRALPEEGWLGLIGVTPEVKRILTYAGLLDMQRVHFFLSTTDAASSLGREPFMPLATEPGPAEYEKPRDAWEKWEHDEPL